MPVVNHRSRSWMSAMRPRRIHLAPSLARGRLLVLCRSQGWTTASISLSRPILVPISPSEVLKPVSGKQEVERPPQALRPLLWLSIQHWADLGEWLLRVVNIPSGNSPRPLSGTRRSPWGRCSEARNNFTMSMPGMQHESFELLVRCMMCKQRHVVLLATVVQFCWLSFAYAVESAGVRVAH